MTAGEAPARRSVLASADFWLAIGFACFLAWVAHLTRDLPSGGIGTELGVGFVPWLCIVGLAILSAALLVRSVVRARQGEVFTVDLTPRLVAKLGVFAVLMLVYAFAYLPLGYLISTGVFFVVAMLALGERRPLHVVGYPAAITLGIWAIFVHLLKVVLP